MSTPIGTRARRNYYSQGGRFAPPDHTRTLNDLSAKWISESGLFELASSSKLPAARAFRKWVFGEVLPSIRKTGSYSVQPVALAAKQTDSWLDKRLEGKELMRLKNAGLQELIAGGFGQTGCKLYAIAANHINQAVLGFTQTTTSFKKQQQLPRHISIPDILNMQGQVARCYAETCFQKFVSDNLQRLRTARGRPDQGVCWAQAKAEAGVRVYWHGGSAKQAADSNRGKEAQSRHSITKQEAAETAAARAA